MRIALIFALLTLPFSVVTGQWRVSLDIGLQSNRFLIVDASSQLAEAAQRPGSIYLVSISYSYTDRVSFTTGFGNYALNFLPTTFSSHPWVYSMSGPPSRLFVVPFRAEYAFIKSRKWEIEAFGGPTLAIRGERLGFKGFGVFSSSSVLGNADWRYDRRIIGEVGLLVEGGVRLKRRLGSRFELSVTYTRSWGFNDFTRDDFSYSLNGGPSQEAVVFNRGSGGMVTLGVGYRLDRFMHESDSRLERHD